MSDDDFMMDDQDFESGEDEEQDNIDMENRYYEAKGHKEDDPEVAMLEFNEIVDHMDSETTNGDWAFKSLKQLIKLSFKLKQYEKTLQYFAKLLIIVKSLSVTRNYAEKSIDNLLNFVGNSQDSADLYMEFLEKFYSVTLEFLQDSKNARLWEKTNLKLAKVWLERQEYVKLAKTLRLLHQSCLSIDGSDDQKKGTTLLEIFALEIQMLTLTKNNNKLKQVYQQCLQVKSAIPHPRIMGVIRECGGKMHMSQKDWGNAQTDFFEAFKNYDEAGSPNRINCLKYLVLANMLMESQINPFDSQETKPYMNDPQIVVMNNLVSAFQRKDIREFENILKKNSTAVMGDAFIKQHIDQLLKNIRSQVMIKLISPYTRIEFSFISQQLNISIQEVEDLLVEMILDKRVDGKIDQINSRLQLKTSKNHDGFYKALGDMEDSIANLFNSSISKVY